MTITQKVFSAIAHTGWRHWRLILLLFLAPVIFSLFALRGLQFETASTVQTGADDGLIRDYRQHLQRFGDSGPLVVVLSHPEVSGHSTDAFTDELAAAISSWDDILYVDARPLGIGDYETATFLLRAAFANSSPDVVDALLERFSKAGINKALQRSRKKVLALDDPALRRLIVDDLLDLRSLITPYYRSRMGNFSFAESGYFDSQHAPTRLLFVQPAEPSEEAAYSIDLLARINRTAERLKFSVTGAEGIQLEFTGSYAISADGAHALKREMTHVSLLAGVLIFTVIVVAFRGSRAVWICFVPVLISLLLVMLCARLFFNPVNLVSIGFAAIVIGLGIDMAIHCTGRFFQISREVPSVEEAVRRTLVDCGPPITIGATTTALAFMCLLFVDYSGMSELGALASIGLLISLCTTVLLFPAMIRLFAPDPAPDLGATRPFLLPRSVYALSSLRPRLSIGLATVIIVASLFVVRNFNFEMDLFKGLPRDLAAMRVAAEVSDDFGASFMWNAQVTIDGETMDEAFAVQKLVDQQLENLVTKKKIAGFESPSLFLPYPHLTATRKKRLQELALQVETHRETFFLRLTELKFRSDNRYVTYYDMIETAIASYSGATSLATQVGIPPERMKRFISEDSSRAYLRTYVWPLNDTMNSKVIDDIPEALSAISTPTGSTFDVTTTHEIYEHINERVRSSFVKVGLISMIVVSLFLLLFFRRISTVFLALLPAAGAILFTFAMLTLTGVPFAPTGIGVIALVAGIGIDDAVHILTRVRREQRNMEQLVCEIGPVLSLTTISTMIGFGVLLYSDFLAVSSLGLAVAIGVFACLMLTLLLIPPLYRSIGTAPSAKTIASVLLLVTLTAQMQAHASDDKLKLVLSQLDKRYRNTSAFTCELTQSKRIEQLVGSMHVAGRIIFQKPHFLNLELRGDENLNIRVNGERVQIEDLDLEETETHDLRSSPADGGKWLGLVPFILENNLTEIQRNFEVSLSKTDRGLVQIDMSSRVTTESPYQQITFDVDSLGRIRWMSVLYHNGDRTETVLRKCRKLRKVTFDLFDIPAPAKPE